MYPAYLHKSILLLLLLFISLCVTAQTGSIQGYVSDNNKHPLKDAFISVSSIADSTLRKTTFTNDEAFFSVPLLPLGDYLLQISYQGFESRMERIHLDAQRFDVGAIQLKIKIHVLDTVTVEEEPILLNKDTTVYNTSRFKVRDYASLGDLVKLLPGLQVNMDGSISINGQPINQIMVDGKPFFNGDPITALHHLPAEIVRQIQVYASTPNIPGVMGQQKGLTGPLTLNLILKANRRKGDFGKATAGGGPDGVYYGSFDLNHMNGPQQVSVVGDVNDVNPEQEINNATGISHVLNGGVNYRDNRSDKTSLYGSYMATDIHNENRQYTRATYLFPGDSSTLLNQQLNSNNHTTGQHIDLSVEHRPDAFNTITFHPNVQLTHSNSVSNQAGMQTVEKTGDTVYQSSGNSESKNDNQSINASLQYQHRGQQPGHSLTMVLNISESQNNLSSYNYSENQYTTYSRNLNQHFTNSSSSLSFTPSVNYTQPLGKDGTFNLSGSYAYSRSNAQYAVFQFNEISQKFDHPDETQSSDFNSIYHTVRVQSSYQHQWSRVSFTAGIGAEDDALAGKDMTKGFNSKKRYLSALPSLAVSLGLGSNKNMQLNYDGKPIMLGIQQLQPVSQTTDSLFIQQGNPDLQQPYIHTIGIIFNSLQTGTQRMLTITLNGSATMHNVQNALTLLDNGAQISKPVNLNGAYSLYGNLNYTIPFTTSSFNIGTNFRYIVDPVLNNDVLDYSKLLNTGATLGWNYRPTQEIIINLSGAPGYNILYSGYAATSNYFTANFSGKVDYIHERWEGILFAYYLLNNGLPADFQPKSPILSPSLSYQVFKKKNGLVKLSVMDMLNQQSGAGRTVTTNLITESKGITRGRYLLLTFTYNISRFGENKR